MKTQHELPALWVEFFQDLQFIRGRSQNTIQAYRRDLELYKEFKSTNKDLIEFFDFMKKKDLSTRTQARVVSSIRTYLKFCDSKGHDSSDLRQLRPPKVKLSLPRPLTLAEFQKLLAACETEKHEKTVRNQLTLLLLFGLGCRVSELISLNMTDYNESQGFMKIVGKGRKERLVPVTTDLANCLRLYMGQVRSRLVVENTPSLLINDRGNRPSRVDIWRWLASWSKKAGFTEPLNPHRFRHGCATVLLENGADLRSIQMLLGHSSLQTTQIYTNITVGHLKKTIEEHHPLSEVEP